MTFVCQINADGKEAAAPVALDRRRRRLSAVVKKHADRRRPFVVSVHNERKGIAPDATIRPTDETVRLRAAWAKTLIGAEDVVLITYLPRGGNAGSIGAALGLLALAFIAPYAIAGLGIGALGTTAATLTPLGHVLAAGLIIGGGYLLSRLTAPASSTNTPLYGVAGGGNLPRPGDRIPVLYGHQVTQPDLTQPDYEVYDGQDQLLYKRMTLGLGKYQVHNIYVGNALFWNETTGIQAPFNLASGSGGSGGSTTGSGLLAAVEIIAPGGSSSLVPASVFSQSLVNGSAIAYSTDNPTHAGPFPANADGVPTTLIHLDFSFPEGIYHQNQTSQGTSSLSYDLLFEYAPCDASNVATGAYSTLLEVTGSMNSTQAHRFSREVAVSSGRYLVRAQNKSLAPGSDSAQHTAMTWDGLRSYAEETITRPHVTEIAMRVRSGKNLTITSFGDIYVESTRIVPVWDGSAWTDTATNKAVWAFADILRSTYGGNESDSRVDAAKCKTYADSLTEYDTFDGTIRGPVSVWEACATVLGVMRAEPARIGNMWSFVRDEPKTVRRHVFTRRQILRGSSTITPIIATDEGQADVIVEFSPSADPRNRAEARATFGTESLTPRRINVIGVSSYNHAYQQATWFSSAPYFRREKISFTADRRGRLVTRGDPIRADMWFASGGRTGGVMARSGTGGTTLTLDTDTEPSGTTYALLKDRKGLEWGPVKATAGGGTRQIVLDATDVAAAASDTGVSLDDVFALDNEEMTSVWVGPLSELQIDCLVSSVTPQDRDQITIEALVDSDDVYSALGDAIPSPPVIPSIGDAASPTFATIPWIHANQLQQSTAVTMTWQVGTARGAASYVVERNYSLSDDNAWEQVSAGPNVAGSLPVIYYSAQPIVRVRAWAIDTKGIPGPVVSTQFSTTPAYLDSSSTQIDVTALNADVQATMQQGVDALAAIAAGGVTPDAVALASQALSEARDTADALIQFMQTSLLSLDQVKGTVSKATQELASGINDQGQEFASNTITLQAAIDGNSAQIVEEQEVRADADAAEATARELIDSQVNDPTTGLPATLAAVVTEATTRAVADSAEATLRSAIDSQVNDPTTGLPATLAAVGTEATTRAADDSSIATSVSTLFAQVNDATTGLPASFSAITTEASTRAADDSTIATALSALTSTVGTNTSAISTEATTRAADDSTIATALAALTSTVGTNTSAIATEATTRAADDSTNATNISTVSSSLGTLSSSVTTNTSTIATLSGTVTASWAVAVDINGRVTGISLIGSGSESDLVFLADKFIVGHPSLNGGTAVPVFSIDTIGGVAVVKIDAAVYVQSLVDLSIKTQHVVPGDVTQEDTQAHAATSVLTTATTLVSTTISTVGGNVYCSYEGGFSLIKYGPGSPGDVVIGLYMDGTLEKSWAWQSQADSDFSHFSRKDAIFPHFTITGVADGSHTFSIHYVSAPSTISFTAGSLTVRNAKV